MDVAKVLIIEPADDVREVLASAAEQRYAVDAVRSGAAMREALARGAHEVVILNMVLPNDDAIALADRAARRGCAVIVVPETPSQFVEAASRSFHILVRPLTCRRVLDAIDRALARVA
jgi:DNA-binding NtrC family response regulator